MRPATHGGMTPGLGKRVPKGWRMPAVGLYYASVSTQSLQE